MNKILFVCTGNICRSPMAEGIFNDLIKKQGKDKNYIALSAGVFACDGQSVSKDAVQAVKEMGVDVSSHISKKLSEDILADSDLVITMTKAHEDAINLNFFKFKDKIFTIHEYVNEDLKDVKDPYGMGLDVYRKCAQEIYDLILTMLRKEEFK